MLNVSNNGYVPLSRLGNIIMRIETKTTTSLQVEMYSVISGQDVFPSHYSYYSPDSAYLVFRIYQTSPDFYTGFPDASLCGTHDYTLSLSSRFSVTTWTQVGKFACIKCFFNHQVTSTPQNSIIRSTSATSDHMILHLEILQ